MVDVHSARSTAVCLAVRLCPVGIRVLRTVRSPSVSVAAVREFVDVVQNDSLLCDLSSLVPFIRCFRFPAPRPAPRTLGPWRAGRGPVVAVRREVRSRGRAGLRPIPAVTNVQRGTGEPTSAKARVLVSLIVAHANARTQRNARCSNHADGRQSTRRYTPHGTVGRDFPDTPPGVYVVHHTTYRLKQLSSVRCVCRHAIRINDPHSSQPLAGLAVHLHTLTNSIAPHKLRMPPSVPRPMLLPARARGLPSPLLPRLHHLLLVKLARGTAFTLR
jgi:hypothetical protein